MRKNYLILQLQKDMERDLIFQQDGAPLHFIHEVTSYLNCTMVAWIGQGGTVAWPPQSSDLTPLDCTVWGYIKDRVFVPTLLANLEEL